MFIKRALLTTVVTVGIIAAGTGIASARPVLDPPDAPYCGPGQEWVQGHCESVWLQVGPGQQQDDHLGWFAVIVPVLALGALL